MILWIIFCYIQMFKYPWNWNTLKYTNIITIFKEDIYDIYRLIPLHALFIHSFSNTLSSVTYFCSFLFISYHFITRKISLKNKWKRQWKLCLLSLIQPRQRQSRRFFGLWKIRLNEERSSNADSIVICIFLLLYPTFIYLFSSVHCPATKLLWL